MYTFVDGTVPDLPSSYDSSQTTQDQDVKQILVDQQAELNLLYYEVKHNEIKDDSVHSQLDSLSSKLQTLIDQGNSNNSTMLDGNSQLLASVKDIRDQTNIVHDTDAMFNTYGFVYVPLIFVITMLWWFFKQFLNSYR